MAPDGRGLVYLRLLAGCVLAGVLGAAFDQLTVSLSRDYFVFGKGLHPDGLRLAVAWLGFRSALPLGAAVTGLALLRRRHGRFTWLRWLTSIGACVAVAILIFAALNVALDPFAVRAEAAHALAPEAITRYLLVWGLHTGVYVGSVFGLAVAWCRTTGTAGRGRCDKLPT